MNSVKSERTAVLSGVLQGAVLRPLLFLVFICGSANAFTHTLTTLSMIVLFFEK